MRLRLSHGRYRFELDLDLFSSFVTMPFVGELACNPITPWCFDGWQTVRRS